MIGLIFLFRADFERPAWLPCDGQTLKMEDYPQLYAVLGNRFGGDGLRTFSLPKLSPEESLGKPTVGYFIIPALYPDAEPDWDSLSPFTYYGFSFFTGQIALWPGEKAPDTWAFCEGQTLLIAEHKAFFRYIGIQFGGDGKVDFNLPNLPPKDGVKYIIRIKGADPERA
jgi:microcystin-dependent protein